MVKHIILWKLKADIAEPNKVKAEIKAGLEGLKGVIPGLIDIKVVTDGLASSNVDLMLDSSFENDAALKNYAINPAHVAIANGKVRPFTASRACFDFVC